MMFVYNQVKLLTRATYANVRYHPHYLTAAKSRAHIVMTSCIVFFQMVTHTLTDIGIKPVSLRLERVFNDE